MNLNDVSHDIHIIKRTEELNCDASNNNTKNKQIVRIPYKFNKMVINGLTLK